MATASEQTPADRSAAPSEVIELEPTTVYESGLVEPVAPPGQAAPPGFDRPSLSTELDALRQSRLKATALVLTLAYAILLVWNLMTMRFGIWFYPGLMALRVFLPAGALLLLSSRDRFTAGQLRAIEYTLFGGLTVLLGVIQFLINRDLLERDLWYSVVAFEKNGILQLVALMFLYGTLIPNRTATAARVILSMMFAPLLAFAILTEETIALTVSQQIRPVEQVGTNLLYVLMAAGLAIYASHVLNGLRRQLHEARRFGQYQILEKIGSGGMGEVYKAEHQLLKRPCALKLIRHDAVNNPLAQARFEREVQSAARLTHPNTIEIYDYGQTDDGTCFYVMEYLPGMSLGDLVQQYGPLPPGRLIYLLRQACRALAEAHALGLIHRDLKPANIFLAIRGGEYDVVKILDFGLVKLTDPEAPELTTDRTVSGTPMFMSPEQATGSRTLDQRSDLYALGAIAYYALTGRPPFLGESPMAIMIAHARDPVEPPSRYEPDIPADLEAVVMRCLAKQPEDRYPNARAVAKALAECAAADQWGDGRAEAWWTATAEDILQRSRALG
jgi:tRNA A-37 threonylcarbamoyl transferase component Bud32